MEIVEIRFEEAELIVPYKWLEEQCSDMDIHLTKVEDDVYITEVSQSTFSEISQRRSITKHRIPEWILVTFKNKECAAFRFFTFADAVTRQRHLELIGYTTYLYYGYK